MAFARFGPGTVTYTVGTGTAQQFAQEVKGGGINHSYEDVGDPTTYLDGSAEPASKVRGDAVTFDCDFQLGAAGYYNFLYTNDLVEATIEFVPNTTDGAKWSGTVQLQLPDGATADAFGSKLSGSVTHQFVGPALFTPSTVAP